MKPKIETINWVNTIEIDNFTQINNVPEEIPFNPFTSFSRFLIEWWKLPTFDNDRNIITDLYSDFIFIEYDNEKVRKGDIENNKKIQKTSIVKSEPIDEIRQLAENVWEFEYNWKIYLVLSPLNALTDETNPEKWIFRWVIVNSDKYFEVNKQVEESNKKLKSIL